MKLEGKTALVTGGSKGIGASISEVLACERGMKVFVNYSSDEEAASELAKQISSRGGEAVLVRSDLSTEAGVKNMFEEIRNHTNTLDVVVGNLGISDSEDGVRNVAAHRRLFAVNYFAQVSVIDESLDMMDYGKIVFISSVHGGDGRGRASAAAYAATKAALNSYMKNLAKDLAPNVLVNAIAPGRTISSSWGEMTESQRAEKVEPHLTRRWIKPEEISQGVVSILENDSICGTILVIDGGMYLKTLG